VANSKKGSRGKNKRESSAFNNVKNQLAYCGLWCGSCSVGNGTVNVLAGKCGKTLTDYGLKDWGPKEVDYDSLLEGLAVLSSMEPCKGCLKGGGNSECLARACAVEKGVSECCECKSEKTCKNAHYLDHMRKGAQRVGMKVKDRKGDRAAVLKGWISESGRA